MSTLQGRSVVVTGGGKGIGLGIASALVAAGARVLVTDRDEAVLDRAMANLGERASYVVADVSSPDDCARTADVAVQRHCGIDVLCFNAGIFPAARLEVMTSDDLAPTSAQAIGPVDS